MSSSPVPSYQETTAPTCSHSTCPWVTWASISGRDQKRGLAATGLVLFSQLPTLPPSSHSAPDRVREGSISIGKDAGRRNDYTVHHRCPLSAVAVSLSYHRIVASLSLSYTPPLQLPAACRLPHPRIDYDSGAWVRSLHQLRISHCVPKQKGAPRTHSVAVPSHRLACCCYPLCVCERQVVLVSPRRTFALAPRALFSSSSCRSCCSSSLEEGAERARVPRTVHNYRHHQKRSNPGHSFCPFIHRASAGDPPRGRPGGIDTALPLIAWSGS